MGMRSRNTDRCPRCRLPVGLCVCAETPRLDLCTRVLVVMHWCETGKPTATGPLALNCLSNGALAEHGRPGTLLDLRELAADPERRALLLFPSSDAEPLTAGLVAADDRPVTLVVPDGSWRQAARMAARVPGLAQLPRVRLPDGPPSAWGIRHEAHPHQVCTFEAIARALGVLESPAVQAVLEVFFALAAARARQARPAHARDG